MVEALLREGRARGVAVVATAGSAHRLGFGDPRAVRLDGRAAASEPLGPRAGRRRRRPLARGRPARPRTVARPAHPVRRPDVDSGDGGGDDLRRSSPWSDREDTWAIVTASPRTDAAALRSLGHEPIVLDALADAAVRAAISARTAPATAPRVVIGDAEAWMANWALAGAMREDATIIVHGGPREYRVLVRARDPAAAPRRSGRASAGWSSPAPCRADRRGHFARTTENVGVRRDRILNPHRMFAEINDSDMIA